MSTAHYRIQILPQAHELLVELQLTGLDGPVTLEVPTWVPGAYGFMKYGRDVFGVRARDRKTGAELAVSRQGWQGYRVDSNGADIALVYRAFAHDSAWGELAGILDHEQAVLLGTRQLFAPAHRGPVIVDYELPDGWPMHHPAGAKQLFSAVHSHRYEYPSYGALLDTPITLGAFELRTRDSHGTPFHFIFLDRAVGFDSEMEGFLDGVMAIADECRRVFGGYPFESYSFIFTFSPKAGWGLEHANATQIALEADALISAKSRFDAIRVCAHELFHAWNVCRLKPAPLGEPDHAQGSFPDALWVSEGFTRYYEFVLSARAGESSASVFFSNVVNYYRHLTALPAYQRISASDSSLTTFLNHNRYPGSVNNTVDYYDLGMLIAFDLDATLRLAGSSLDAEFSAFYRARAGKDHGFTSAEICAFFASRKSALAALCAREVESAGQLGTEALLEQLGFKLQYETRRQLGLVLSEDKGPSVSNVLDDGPASAAGVAPGDEIVRVNGFPFQLAALQWLIKKGAPLEIEVLRGQRRFQFTIASTERRQICALLWRGGPEQTVRLSAWLGTFDLAAGSTVPLTDYDNFHGIQTVI